MSRDAMSAADALLSGELTLADRRTTRERVYETLHRAILGGTLAGGARLVQSEIANVMGVSTTPVREALRELAAEGLVQFDSYRGAIVKHPNLEEVREVYKLRLILEPVAIREAVTSQAPESTDRAVSLWRQMESEGDPGRWVELNRAFHATFDETAGSPLLMSILNNLRDSAARLVGLSLRAEPARMAEAQDDHRELIDAWKARDGDWAAEVLTRHFKATLESVERYLQQTRPPEEEGG